MDAAVVGHQRNLVVNALSDRQPVQRVTKYGSDVLVESSAVRSGDTEPWWQPAQRVTVRGAHVYTCTCVHDNILCRRLPK